MTSLEICNLTKKYGNLTVVNNINLKIEKGSIFGFLGLNGAGKTTTIRMITGLAKPDSGEINILGKKVEFGSTAVNRFIGYLPDVPEFYTFMKPDEYLALCGKLSGMKKEQINKKTQELLTLVGLENVKRHIGGFSRGMKQRLGIAQALIHEPELLILDEPTSALDPVGRKELLDIIAALRGRLTVLFSTHILSDVERVCDTIGVLHKGNLVLQGNLEDIEKKYSNKGVIIETTKGDKVQELKKRLSGLPYIKEIRQESAERLIVICGDTEKLYESICPLFSEMGLPLSHFEKMESNLEDVFMEVVGR